MRPCPHRRRAAPRPGGGPAIETLILLLFGLATLTVLGTAVARMIQQRRARDQHGPGGSEDAPRTDEERERDRRTAITWGCLVLAVPVLLVLAYLVTR